MLENKKETETEQSKSKQTTERKKKSYHKSFKLFKFILLKLMIEV